MEEEGLRAERKDWVWRDRNKDSRVWTAGYSYCLSEPTDAREPQHTHTQMELLLLLLFQGDNQTHTCRLV